MAGFDTLADATAYILDMDRRVRELAALAAGEAPHLVGGAGEPAFAGAWINNDNGAAAPSGSPTHRNAQFRRHFGEVRLEGVVKSGSGTIFTLPAGYRPPVQRGFIVVGNNTDAFVVVQATGAVDLVAGSSAFLFLDQIRFHHT